MQNPMYPDQKGAPNPFMSSQGNPFNRLENEISSSVIPSLPALSADDLLNQLASPLIKSWLDQNLRKIVEETVQKEIDRMRRS
jgi:cell pole-organizing protein PopZ